MEIQEISMMSEFEAGIKCLQNPTSISRFLRLPGIAEFSQVYSFWTWGALIVALIAAFSSIINGVKLLILRFRAVKCSASSSQSLLRQGNGDSDFSEDDTTSDSASDDGEYESISESPSGDRGTAGEDFRVAGSSYLGEYQGENGNLNLRRRSCSPGDLFLWTNSYSLGLGLDFEDGSESVVSLWDSDKDQKVSSIFGGVRQIPAVTMSSPAVVLSAEMDDSDGVIMSAYDTRMAAQIPTIYAEWRPQRSKAVGIGSGGVEKVFIRDGVTGAFTVRDMRNVKTPLENVTESDGDTWWDADAVIVENEFVDGM